MQRLQKSIKTLVVSQRIDPEFCLGYSLLPTVDAAGSKDDDAPFWILVDFVSHSKYNTSTL